VSVRERLHELIDQLSEDEVVALLFDLESPPPPLSDEDKASIARAFADSDAGRIKSHAEVMRKYGIAG
jgi:hypothetical protein